MSQEHYYEADVTLRDVLRTTDYCQGRTLIPCPVCNYQLDFVDTIKPKKGEIPMELSCPDENCSFEVRAVKKEELDEEVEEWS